VSHPDIDALADLALGEPVADEVREHVTGCAPCRSEVEALAATREALRAPLPELVPASPALRAATLAAATDELAARRDATAPEPVRPASRRFGAGWLAAAAVAGLLVGGVGAVAVDRSREPQPAPEEVLAKADLDTLDTGTSVGVADLVRTGGNTDLALHTQPMGADDGYLEVWLINRDLKRMVSIGVMQPGRTDQSFTIPAELVDQGYVIVDISREPYDEDARHSGTSLARGTLPV
jgi:hypothetical protein